MKQLVLLFLCIASMALTSCKSLQTFFQVCEVGSSLNTTAKGNYEYTDDACSISYDFWCDGGNPGFVFTNNTDEIIYIDLTKSFFIKNGIAYDYYLNRTISSSASYVESASATKSGTAYGYWNYSTPGALTGSLGSSSSAAKTSTLETAEKQIIAVPPHTSKDFSEYAISSNLFYACENNITPKKKEIPTYSYQLVNSPLTFGNFITYRIGNDAREYSVTNDFFVKEVSYYHKDAIVVKKEVGCPDDTEVVEVLTGSSPIKFYIQYSRSLSRSNVKGPNAKGVRKVKSDYDNWF